MVTGINQELLDTVMFPTDKSQVSVAEFLLLSSHNICTAKVKSWMVGGGGKGREWGMGIDGTLSVMHITEINSLDHVQRSGFRGKSFFMFFRSVSWIFITPLLFQ